MNLKDQIRLLKAIGRYESTTAVKQGLGSVSRIRPHRFATIAPSVTVFLTSYNNRYPLELTLRTLASCTAYPNYTIVVGDNESSDGSLELLTRLSQELPLTVIQARKPQSDWYDEMYRTVTSKYWVGVHEDLIFFGHDWLADLIARMERDPDVWLIEGEWFPPKPGFVEPVSHETIDLRESLSTWLFCLRTSLRDRLPDATFAFFRDDVKPDGRRQCWDLGGKVLEEMRGAGLRYEVMPWWFRTKWHHIGNLSWAERYGAGGTHARLKRFQRDDARRRVLRRWGEVEGRELPA